jgi:lysophospholipase L1-like esterase
MKFFEDITILKKAKDRYKHMKKTTVKQIADKMTSAQNYTIFIVGDSITEGARATDDDCTYTAVFASGVEGDFCHPSDIGHAAIANEMLARLFE